MPYMVNSDSDIAHVVLSGHLTVPEVVAAAQAVDEIDAGTGPARHRLVDISNVENLHVSFSEMNGFSALRRTVKLKNPVRTAVVARTPVQFGVGRMFELLNQQPQTTVAVFKDSESARRWLAGEEELKVHMI